MSEHLFWPPPQWFWRALVIGSILVNGVIVLVLTYYG
jgi:hypothetical protein